MKSEIQQHGTKVWCLNGKYHNRLDEPVIEWVNGDKFWYLNNKLHRIDGPAYEHPNGHKEWHKYGRLYIETL